MQLFYIAYVVAFFCCWYGKCMLRRAFTGVGLVVFCGPLTMKLDTSRLASYSRINGTCNVLSCTIVTTVFSKNSRIFSAVFHLKICSAFHTSTIVEMGYVVYCIILWLEKKMCVFFIELSLTWHFNDVLSPSATRLYSWPGHVRKLPATWA